MPDHIHGIIIIRDYPGGCVGPVGPVGSVDSVGPVDPVDSVDPGRVTMHRDPTGTQTGTQTGRVFEQFGKPTSNSIPTIIRGYKSAVTNRINELRNMPCKPVWQRNYYEHIIRDDKSFWRISRYIKNNPVMYNP